MHTGMPSKRPSSFGTRHDAGSGQFEAVHPIWIGPLGKPQAARANKPASVKKTARRLTAIHSVRDALTVPPLGQQTVK